MKAWQDNTLINQQVIQFDVEVNILLAGNADAGKNSLVSRFIEQKYLNFAQDNSTRSIILEIDTMVVKANILTQHYYSKDSCNCGFINHTLSHPSNSIRFFVSDGVTLKSLNETKRLAKEYNATLPTHNGLDILVINKIDLADKNQIWLCKEQTSTRALNATGNHFAAVHLISALTGEGVTELFTASIKSYLQKYAGQIFNPTCQGNADSQKKVFCRIS